MTMHDLLTLEDAAATLPATITVSTLRGLIRKGDLPYRKIGRRLYLTLEDLRRLTECPANDFRPGSINDPTRANLSSEMVISHGGRAAALQCAERLRRRSRDTSKPDRNPGGAVLPMQAR